MTSKFRADNACNDPGKAPFFERQANLLSQTTTPNPPAGKIGFYGWLSLAVVLIASLLMLRQEHAYNNTYDEGVHMAAGMQWLSKGTYTYDELAPPFARVAMALPLWVEGLRTEGYRVENDEGLAILDEHGQYWQHLRIIRLAVMPFFWLANLVIFIWARRRFGGVCAFASVLIFSFCPTVLGNSAIAALDAPFMTMFLLAVVCFDYLLESPSWQRGLFSGATFALAVLTKYTGLPFFLVTALLMLVWHLRSGRHLRPLLKPSLVGAGGFALTVWALFRFSIGPLYSPASLTDSAHHQLASMHSGLERTLLQQVLLPAPGFFRGILYAFRIGAVHPELHRAFLLGSAYSGGRWYFFPVALLVKTPIAMILLAAVGVWWAASRRFKSAETAMLFSGILGPLAVGMAAKVNLGVRHVLPIYPFLALLGGLGATVLLEGFSASRAAADARPSWTHRRTAWIAALLLGWEALNCVWTSPEFLPYFNEAAMPFFGRIIVVCDLDWGQDLFRLEDRLRSVDSSQVSIMYFGDPSLLKKHSPGEWRTLVYQDSSCVGGLRQWTALSETNYAVYPECFSWLAKYPFERIGRSIRLYHLPDSLPASAPALSNPSAPKNTGEDR